MEHKQPKVVAQATVAQRELLNELHVRARAIEQSVDLVVKSAYRAAQEEKRVLIEEGNNLWAAMEKEHHLDPNKTYECNRNTGAIVEVELQPHPLMAILHAGGANDEDDTVPSGAASKH